jgi:hypothetical protein
MKSVLTVLVVLGIAGLCWWYWTKERAAPPGIAAIVDFPENYSTCTVSLGGSTTGRSLPCQDVGAYLRKDLKLSAGAGVLIRPRGKSSRESWEAMTNQIHDAGFLIAPWMGGGITPEVNRGDR